MTGAAIILVMMAAAGLTAQPLRPSPPSPVPFLDVPYIPQSEALCGGAAAAMVLRYWGATGINAETFAPLLDASATGIHAADLLKDLQARGWDAKSFSGDAALIASRLGDRQPVVTLIEDRPGVFHYVVIVAWTNQRVILHDPARGPFRVVDAAAFDRAWQKSNRWTMLLLPGARNSATGAPPAPVPPGANAAPVTACSGMVTEAVRAVERNDATGAMAMLRSAADLCPADSGPLRELAGIFALQENWAEAARHAEDAVRRNSRDDHAWRILATSSFVLGNMPRALSAWNHVGEPVLDIVNIRGLEHTRYLAAFNAMRLRPEGVLNVDDLAAASRRLSELPAARTARVTYRPLANGRAAIDAVVIEHGRSPLTKSALAANALRALSDNEVTAAVANPTGAGDFAAVTWRWWDQRPRIGASYATPVRFGGVLRIDLARDEQTYGPTEGKTQLREVRRGGSLALSDWTTRGFRWELGLGVDVWRDQGRTLTTTASLERRFRDDRASITGQAAALSGGVRTATLGVSAAWRSSTRHDGTVWLVRSGADWAGASAPLALWPGAGTGQARPVPLRAHPLLDDGAITGDVFGRRLYHGSSEARRWLRPLLRVVRVAPAVFIDTARAERRRERGSAWEFDAGAGLRVAVPGSGVLRLDVAKGVRDGATAFSIGWTR